MAQELFFTSAERGLQSGSFGYCTVARTARLPRSLQSRLEQASTYRPLFPPHDPRAESNPIVVSHTRVTMDGQSVSILSRVSSSAPDYSGRTNYLAHHVVLEASERCPAGPAWLATQPGTLAAAWDGQVREIALSKSVPRGNQRPSLCRAWQHATGDAGWAGVLAEHLVTKPTQPFFLLFDAGADLLPLIAEVIAILPLQRRWDVTFSTYFTGLAANTQCTIRGVVRGSEEMGQARAGAHLDLRGLLERTPPDNQYVQAARAGHTVGSATPEAEPGQAATYPVQMPDEPVLGARRGRTVDPLAESPRRPALELSLDEDDDMPPPPPSSGNKWIWIMTGAAAALLVLGGAVVIALNSNLLTARPDPTTLAQSDEKKPGSDDPEKKKENTDPAKPGTHAKPGTPAKPGDTPEKKPVPIGADTTELEKKAKGGAGAATLPPPPVEEDAKFKLIQEELNKAQDERKKALEQVKAAEKDRDQARTQSADLEAQLKELRGKYDGKAWIQARKGGTITLSLSDDRDRVVFPEVIKPADVYLVRKPGVGAIEAKIDDLLHVTWLYTPRQTKNGWPTFTIKAQKNRGFVEAEHYFDIWFDSESKKETLVFCQGLVTKDNEKERRKKFIEYLKQHVLVTVEVQQVERGAKPFEGSPRITVFEFDEGK